MEVAARVIHESGPFRFGVATTAEDLDAVFRLRHQVVIQEGWSTSSALPNAREYDVFDEQAVQIAAWFEDEIVGTSRLVLPRPDRLLPHEEAFGLAVEPRGRVVDSGRSCVAAQFRDRRHRLFNGLLAQVCIEMRKRGYELGLGAAAPQMVRMLQMMRIDVKVLAPAREYWGEHRYPILFDLSKSAHELAQRTRSWASDKQ